MFFLKAFQVELALNGAECDAHYYDQVDAEDTAHAVDHTRSEVVLIVEVKDQWEQTEMVGAQLQANLIHDLNISAQFRIMRLSIPQIVDIEHIGEQEDMDADVRVIQT